MIIAESNKKEAAGKPSWPEDELSIEDTFLLGLLLVSGKTDSGHEWDVAIRRNKKNKKNSSRKAATKKEVYQEVDNIKALVERTDPFDEVGPLCEKNDKNKNGAVFKFKFKQICDIDSLLDLCDEVIVSQDLARIRSLILGAFATGYHDINKKNKVNHLVVDIKDRDIETAVKIEDVLSDALGIFGISASSNVKRGSDKRKKPRNPQFRLSSKSLMKYYTGIGFTSPHLLKEANAFVMPNAFETSAFTCGLIGVTCLREDPESFDDTFFQSELASGKYNEELDGDYVQGEDGPRDKPPKKKSGQRSAYAYNQQLKIKALRASGFRCELDGVFPDRHHPDFINEATGKPYLETHHLIPLSRQDDFDYAVDNEANIVALCCSCHSEIHYGEKKNELIEKLFEMRKERLALAKLKVTYDDLRKMYQ